MQYLFQIIFNNFSLSRAGDQTVIFHFSTLRRYEKRLNEIRSKDKKLDQKLSELKPLKDVFLNYEYFPKSFENHSFNQVFLLENPDYEEFKSFLNFYTIQQISENKSYLTLINSFLKNYSLENQTLIKTSSFYFHRLLINFNEFTNFLEKNFNQKKEIFTWSNQKQKLDLSKYQFVIGQFYNETLLTEKDFPALLLIDNKNILDLNWSADWGENKNIEKIAKEQGREYLLKLLGANTVLAFWKINIIKDKKEKIYIMYRTKTAN